MDNKTDISWADFVKVDLRVGTIVAAEISPTARKDAYVLTIDFGPLGTLRSSAQITDRYTTESLLGRQVIAVVNFPPKQVANVMSQCLVLGSVADDGSVTLLRPDMPVANGSAIA